MGVTGLWKLIEPCGKPVPVETLEGKVLAIDLSIWLHQVVKGYQDSKGSALENAHLLGLFHRLCKLLYYRVRPVFVFDGSVPQIKMDTMARRQEQRSKLNTEADRIQVLLLQSLAKEKVVQQALGSNVDLLLKSPVNTAAKGSRNKGGDEDEMFKLPALPAPFTGSKNNDEESECNSTCTGSTSDDYTSTDDSTYGESNLRFAYDTDLQSIDVRSQYFRDLPADVRHEILVDIKETRKQSSWGRLHELPSNSGEFSTFQMKRLLKRRAVQESLEEAEQEMGGHVLTFQELKNLFTEEGIVEPSAMEKNSKQICSDENTRFLLVRDLKKKMSKGEEKSEDLEKPSTSKACKVQRMETIEEPVSESTVAIEKIEDSEEKNDSLGNEYDSDLALAIALSIEEANVYNKKDYEFNSGDALKLNRKQRDQLKNAAVGPARAYMIECAGMNEDEVVEIMEKTQTQTQINAEIDASGFEDFIAKPGGADEEENGDAENKKEDVIFIQSSEEFGISDTETKNKSFNASKANKDEEVEDEIRLHVSDDSGTDTDLEEVTEIESNPVSSHSKVNSEKPFEIIVDLKNMEPVEDDIFADVFQNDGKSIEDKSDIQKKSDPLDKSENEKPTSEDQKSISTQNPQSSAIKQHAKSDIKSNEELVLISNNIADNKMLSILDELKKQIDNVKNINLNDVKIESSVINLSDEEGATPKACTTPTKIVVKSEVIEVYDSDDDKMSTTCKSPILKTPSKTKSISEFFDIRYVIKRTPDKPNEEDEEAPKVKSPFFVNKTPKSNSKNATKGNDTAGNSPTQANKISKASKSLFGNFESETVDATVVEMETAKEPLSEKDVVNEAAQLLREQITENELKELSTDLQKEKRNLEYERNRQDRMGMSITQRMNSQCQELLRLFGVPYIVAPMEAEAQCAFLDAIKLTNGTITDDSDIWLFGGRTVYKNFFAQNKHVLEFRAEQIENSFNCDRKKLIQLACLVGSDYTTGVHGIGAVTAMEILALFSPAKESLPNTGTNESAAAANILATLTKFRDWWLANKTTASAPGSSARLALRKKLKNIELNESFPSITVIDAYLSPAVDKSEDPFQWGNPDIESIREFTKKTFGWTTSKTNDILTPVLKKLNEKRTQATIKNYFNVKSAISVRQLPVSKRVQNAIDRMGGRVEETPEKPKKRVKRSTKDNEQNAKAESTNADSSTANNIETDALTKTTRTSRTKRKQQVKEPTQTENATTIKTSDADGNEIVVSKFFAKNTAKLRKVAASSSNSSNEIIPQRLHDLEQLKKNKEKAIEVLKKTRGQTAKKRKN